MPHLTSFLISTCHKLLCLMVFSFEWFRSKFRRLYFSRRHACYMSCLFISFS